MRQFRMIGAALLLLTAISCKSAGAADRTIPQPLKAGIQAVLNDYLARRGAVESVSGVSLYVSLGSSGPDVAMFAGTDGRVDHKPITAGTLFQIGSNTKHFTAALILKLEAAGKLTLDQEVGQWLPQYPAWKNIKIRSLLNMTSTIPNYSETPEIGGLIAADLHHQFQPQQLIAAVDPDAGKHLPPNSGWFYSNTNSILAALIIEKASGLSYKDALETLLFRPLDLRETYYADGPYPRAVLDRLPRGLYENKACLDYQPIPCAKSTLAPLLGRDMSMENMSWAGAAGAIVSNPHDLATWIRALFTLRVFPKKQLGEMTTLVSSKTGLPIEDVTAEHPAGFGLDLGRVYRPETGGAFWFYQGTTLGSRAVFAYWPQYDLVLTCATNSQPPEGQDRFLPDVVGRVFDLLRDAKALGSGDQARPAPLAVSAQKSQ